MASKFRARSLDNSKPMQIIYSEQVPEVLEETSQLSRAVPVLPTGMEKEEEGELHIMQAISQQQMSGSMKTDLVIPTPDANLSVPYYDEMAPRNYVPPKQYIRVQLFDMSEKEVPDYDIDSDDETFLTKYRSEKSNGELSTTNFERIMERMDEGPLRPNELSNMLSIPEPVCKKVHKYYQTKIESLRKKGQNTAMPQIKPDLGDALSGKDPYVAFRRRVEKMQTRKNRKNDEYGYMNMLKLKRDFEGVRNLLEMIRERERTKKDLLNLELDIIGKRFEMEDWEGTMLKQVTPRPAIPREHKVSYHDARELQMKKKKRRKDQIQRPGKLRIKLPLPVPLQESEESTEEYENTSAVTEDEWERDGEIKFRRRAKVLYHAPLQEPAMRTTGTGQYFYAKHPKTRITPSSSRAMRPMLRGFCRRRIGRGGRVFIDRCARSMDWFDELTQYTPEQLEDMKEYQTWAESRHALLEEKRRRAAAGNAPSVQQQLYQKHQGEQPGETNGAAPQLQQLHHQQQQQQQQLKMRFPLAGNDFGNGIEPVDNGPLVKVLKTPTKTSAEPATWLPVNDAEAAVQRSKAGQESPMMKLAS